ncbi:MAG: hypothetical protein J5966_03255 [Lachnospiraceae bacterium]|nr:hypothetical protein [Lachnospiraceae bacterium]
MLFIRPEGAALRLYAKLPQPDGRTMLIWRKAAGLNMEIEKKPVIAYYILHIKSEDNGFLRAKLEMHKS